MNGPRFVPLVLASCALMVAAGCGPEGEQSTRKSATVRAEATPSPDLASRAVEGDELRGLYANLPDAVIALAVQMRDAKGATAEAKRQFSSAFAPYPGEPRCATGIERFEVPRVPGAVAVEVRHEVDGNVVDSSTIVFTKGALVYQVFASGAGIDHRREELIDAARALYERVPVDRSREGV